MQEAKKGKSRGLGKPHTESATSKWLQDVGGVALTRQQVHWSVLGEALRLQTRWQEARGKEWRPLGGWLQSGT